MQHYDPVAAAAEAWGDDGSLPIRYDPIAAAQEGWGDDESLPVHYDPVATDQERWDEEDNQEAHYDPEAQAQEDWGYEETQPVIEVTSPAQEEVPEVPPEAAEGEEAAPTVDIEEGQVTGDKLRDAFRVVVDASAM